MKIYEIEFERPDWCKTHCTNGDKIVVTEDELTSLQFNALDKEPLSKDLIFLKCPKYGSVIHKVTRLEEVYSAALSLFGKPELFPMDSIWQECR